MRVILLSDGKEHEAKRWKDMSEDERENAVGRVRDCWEDNDIFLKLELHESGCEWEYFWDNQVEIIEE